MSFGKRVDGHSGRRTQTRTEVMLPASATTLNWSQAVLVFDLSTTGARLQGADFPESGATLLLKFNEFEALATVLWRGEGECGVEIEEPLTEEMIERFRRESSSPLTSNLSADERIAIAHWADLSSRKT